jgi:dihydroorotate dehydrogenase
VAHIYRLTNGQVPIIGVGGVASAADAYAMIRSGARLVQLYTGMVYAGPGAARDIKRGLAQLLWRDGLRTTTDAVGVDVR